MHFQGFSYGRKELTDTVYRARSEDLDRPHDSEVTCTAGGKGGGGGGGPALQRINAETNQSYSC